MALNDKNMLSQTAKGNTTYPGIANPTAANDMASLNPKETNFVNDPASSTFGAGAHPTQFRGHKDAKQALQQQAGVIEARPGIIESTNIHPLNENSNKDDGWANATVKPGGQLGSSGPGIASKAAATATGAAKLVYGTVIGDEQAKQAGRDALYGKQ